MKKTIREYASLLLPVIFILAADQSSKHWVRQSLELGESWAPWDWLMPYARIVNWQNTGVAFGLFQGKGTIFSVVAVLVVLAILYYYPKISREDWPLRLALVLQMGGALGNLIDRLTQGFVTDFISIGTFAVFNIADSCITVGVGILLLGVYLQERREATLSERQVTPEANPAGETDEPDLSEGDESGQEP